MEPGVPESFNVLIRELQSLCLDVELIKAGEKKPTCQRRSRLRAVSVGRELVGQLASGATLEQILKHGTAAFELRSCVAESSLVLTC